MMMVPVRPKPGLLLLCILAAVSLVAYFAWPTRRSVDPTSGGSQSSEVAVPNPPHSVKLSASPASPAHKAERPGNETERDSTQPTRIVSFEDLVSRDFTSSEARSFLADNWDGSLAATARVLKELPPSSKLLLCLQFHLARSFVREFPKNTVRETYDYLRGKNFAEEELSPPVVGAMMFELVIPLYEERPLQSLRDLINLCAEHPDDPGLPIALQLIGASSTSFKVKLGQEDEWRTLLNEIQSNPSRTISSLARESGLLEIAIKVDGFSDIASQILRSGDAGARDTLYEFLIRQPAARSSQLLDSLPPSDERLKLEQDVSRRVQQLRDWEAHHQTIGPH